MEETTLPGKSCTLLHYLFVYISQSKETANFISIKTIKNCLYLEEMCLFYHVSIDGNDIEIRI